MITLCFLIYDSVVEKKIRIRDCLRFVLLILVAIVLSLIENKIISFDANNHVEKKISVGYIQGSFSDRDYGIAKKYPEYGKEIANYYYDNAVLMEKVDVIILPESSCPLDNNENNEMLKRVISLSHEKNCFVIAGYHFEDNNHKEQSTMWLISSDGQTQKHTKYNLIPYAETDELNSGKDIEELMKLNNIIIKPMICYESIFVKNYYSLEDYDIIVCISNDSFGDNTVLNTMHKAYTIQNAKKFKKPLLFICGSGESFYIDRDGCITTLGKYGQSISGIIDIYI